ncbi:MAG TPA: hypothetical protein VFH66_13645 [Mycobacteriales bacterium]|nr:hypothetical protein [Mycobacteriales bacterium]
MRRRAQLRRAAMLLGGVAVPLGWLLAAPAAATVPTTPASATPVTVTVGDVSEAWFASAPVDICTSPLGCPPADAPASPYPADTLHVGLAGGQETSRSYLLPDTSFLMSAGTISSAVMTLPVATGSTDGTQSPETAHILACLATQPFSDGQQGSVMPPPKADCSTSSPASYDAKKSVLTIDVAPLLSAWTNGTPALGIALVPDTVTSQQTDAWHVTIDGRKRSGTPHVQTVVRYTPVADSTGQDLGGTTTSGSTTPVTSVPPPASQPSVQLPAPTGLQPPVSPPLVATPQRPTTTLAQPAAYALGTPPSIAFVVPLLLLGAGIFFARVFTRDATPLSVRS